MPHSGPDYKLFLEEVWSINEAGYPVLADESKNIVLKIIFMLPMLAKDKTCVASVLAFINRYDTVIVN